MVGRGIHSAVSWPLLIAGRKTADLSCGVSYEPQIKSIERWGCELLIHSNSNEQLQFKMHLVPKEVCPDLETAS
jgi:hypothetical protein